MTYKLYAALGSGSAIVEALFAFTDIKCEVHFLQYGTHGIEDQALEQLNPLRQVPTLVLPNGGVMTESAAITLHLADISPESTLMPSVSDNQRPAFLRWLLFLVASIYPTFSFGDFPNRWVTSPAAREELTLKTDAHRQMLWRYLEDQISSGPWFISSPHALDIYISVMTHWRPRRLWFKENCPNIYRIACEIDQLPNIDKIWSHNFGE